MMLEFRLQPSSMPENHHSEDLYLIMRWTLVCQVCGNPMPNLPDTGNLLSGKSDFPAELSIWVVL